MAHPKEILDSLQAAARKSLSQNFLTSPHWADLLTDSVSEGAADEYWEIGPGLGALTARLLAKVDRPVRLFEFDRKLSAYLREKFPRAQLFEGDFLKVEIPLVAPPEARIALLSNLPYHLSSPILFRLIEEKHRFTRIVLTFQKEFADRLIASPRGGDYGALSILCQLHFSLKSLGVLPKGAFYPVPGVASEALLLIPHTSLPEGAQWVAPVVKAAFAHRRKKVERNLGDSFPTAPVKTILGTLGIAPMARPEEISKELYLAIAQAIGPHLADSICEK